MRKFFEFQSDDNTFDLNASTVGTIPEGIYAGFDNCEIANVPTLPNTVAIMFTHSDTGKTVIDGDGNTIENVGVFVTKQGVKVWETDPVYAYAQEVALGDSAICTLVARHTYTKVAGGLPVSYEIYQHPTQYPTIPNPENCVELCHFVLTSGATTFRKIQPPIVTKESVKVSDFEFGGTLTLKASQATIAGSRQLTMGSGNIFYCGGNIDYVLANKPDLVGVSSGIREITLITTAQTIIRDSNILQDMGVVAPPIGYKWIRTFASEMMTLQEGSIIVLIELDDTFVVKSVSSPLYNSVSLYEDLSNKGNWGNNAGFRVSVKQVLPIMLPNVWQNIVFSTPQIFNFNPKFTITDDGFLELWGTFIASGSFVAEIPSSVFGEEVLAAITNFEFDVVLPYNGQHNGQMVSNNVFFRLKSGDPSKVEMVGLNIQNNTKVFLNGLKIRCK